MKPICEIVNGFYSYILIVDNERIKFHTIEAAYYFEKHYKKLGYKIIKGNV